METLQLHKKILSAEICPYCGSYTRSTNQKEVYGKSFSKNKVIVCCNYPKCDSYVGCHKSGKPLGRLGDKDLRKAKKEAHFWFDKLWKEKGLDRGDCYLRLSIVLGLRQQDTHIGMFKIETCRKVSKWARDEYNSIK